MSEKPLDGLKVVVCRPRDQALPLIEVLVEEGAEIVHAPVIAIDDPADGGAELRASLESLMADDWLVVTSPNGAARVAAALARGLPDGVRLAVIGPGTADRARADGLAVDLMAERSVAEGLLEVFPAPEGDGGSVVLARAEVARDTLPDGLRAMGWDVTDVAAYRTVTADLTADEKKQASAAAIVAFTSSSTVDRLVDQLGADSVPPLIVSIGPATSATVRGHDLDVAIEATDHTIPGLVEALLDHARSWGRETS